MAVDRIRLDESTADGANTYRMLIRAINNVRSAQDDLEHVKAVMDENIDGSDYTDLELEFGVPTGDGATVYNLVTGTIVALDAYDIQTTIARIGQG